MNCLKYTDLLKLMVAVPSPSFQEEAVAGLICSELEKDGIEVSRPGGNILAVKPGYDPHRRTLALIAHMDTVAPNKGYTRDPYDPGDDTGIIYGLGSNDDGGCVVSMIAAFAHFMDIPLNINLMLIISREEERSGPDGSSFLFGQGGFFETSAEYRMPDWVIVGEPTGLRAASSERGLLVLDALAKGKAGHAARDEGVNSLYIALEDIAALRGYDFGRISKSMGKVHLAVTMISAGEAHNVVPAECRFTVDIRPTDVYSNEEIVSSLQAICKSTLTPRSLHNRSSATPEGSLLLRAVRDSGIETFSSPTTSDWMSIPVDAIKIGPGESSRSHKADEFILVEEIRQAISTYIKLICCIDEYSLE